MIDLVIEGLESLRFPCSWIILFPALGLTIFGRHRRALITSIFVASSTLVAWLRFAGWWFAVPGGAVQILLGVGVAVAVFWAWIDDSRRGDIGLAAITAVAAVSAWIPCVGPALGSLLNDARSAPWANAPGTVAFMVGLLLPFALVAAMSILSPRLAERLGDPRLAGLGALILAAFALLFMTTLFDDVASELARRSSF